MTHEEALALVARLGNVPETLEYLDLEDPEEFARTYQLYGLLGYKEPVSFGIELSVFWEAVTLHMNKLDAIETDRGYVFRETETLKGILERTGKRQITYLEALKELEVLRKVAKSGRSWEATGRLEETEDLKDFSSFAREHYLYYSLGYLPPSKFGLELSVFWARVTPHLDELDTFYVPNYSNSYTQDGKWFAFRETELLTDLLTAAKTDYPEKQTTSKTEEEEDSERNTWDLW